MKAFFAILLTSWLTALMLPWWLLFIFSFLFGGWLIQNKFISLCTGFIAGGLGWFLQSLYIHIANDELLTSRMADLTNMGSPWAILGITFLVAAIPCALASLAGTQFADLASSKHEKDK